jgi:hypothetical protein
MILEITTIERDGTGTLTGAGEIDMTSAPVLRRAFDQAPAQGRLVVSADAVVLRILDLAGLSDLLTVHVK